MPSPPSVVAIIAAYNEADIIETVVADLLDQDIKVYFLDDGSTDGTAEIVERHNGNGVLAVERLPQHQNGEREHGFAWERILGRKAQLATELDADWFIHHDADEFRESPWPGMTLRDGIGWVDRLGFNAIDFVCLDFWPDREGFVNGHDVRDVFTRFAPAAPYDRVQIRCWKKTDSPVDLTTSGGHEAQFESRRVFPVRFILRHYPIRGQQHGERKVFHERRFLEAERERGWHVQYDAFREGRSFLHDPSSLEPYDPDSVRLSLTLQHRGVEELEGALSTSRTETEARTRDLAERDRDLAARRQELEAKTTEFNDLTRELERVRSENEATARELDQHRTELATAARNLAQREADFAALSQEARDLRGRLDEHTADLALTRKEYETRCAEIEVLNRHLESARSANDRVQRACDDRGGELEAFRRSLSWRVTAPARALYRLLSGQK